MKNYLTRMLAFTTLAAVSFLPLVANDTAAKAQDVIESTVTLKTASLPTIRTLADEQTGVGGEVFCDGVDPYRTAYAAPPSYAYRRQVTATYQSSCDSSMSRRDSRKMSKAAKAISRGRQFKASRKMSKISMR